MAAILFGSISTLADTSELQRHAFNDAFAGHGLDWRWDRDTYRGMLADNGGSDRISAYARRRGDVVDAPAVHAAKTERFHELLASQPAAPRAGVLDSLRDARSRGITVALATTTSRANVDAVLAAIGLNPGVFAFILDAEQVHRPKPDPEVYRVALDRLAEGPVACLAIEDNPGGVAAATAAGLPCVAFPNANTVEQDFPGSLAVVDRVDLDELLPHLEVAP